MFRLKTYEEDMWKIGSTQAKLTMTILGKNRSPAQKRSSQNRSKVFYWNLNGKLNFLFYALLCLSLFLPKPFFPPSGQILKGKFSFKMRSWKHLSGGTQRGNIFAFFGLFKRHWRFRVFFHVFQRGLPLGIIFKLICQTWADLVVHIKFHFLLNLLSSKKIKLR